MKPGLTQLAIGVYSDDRGGLHLFVEELLEANGYADTPENRETLTRAARDMMAQLYPGQPLTEDAQRLANDPAITRIVDFTCPYCRHVSNAAGTVDGMPSSPVPGDICACLECGGPMVFILDPIDGHTLRLRRMNQTDAAALSPEQKSELAKVAYFARHVLPVERARRN